MSAGCGHRPARLRSSLTSNSFLAPTASNSETTFCNYRSIDRSACCVKRVKLNDALVAREPRRTLEDRSGYPFAHPPLSSLRKSLPGVCYLNQQSPRLLLVTKDTNQIRQGISFK